MTRVDLYLGICVLAFPAAVAFKSAPALDGYFGNERGADERRELVVSARPFVNSSSLPNNPRTESAAPGRAGKVHVEDAGNRVLNVALTPPAAPADEAQVAEQPPFKRSGAGSTPAVSTNVIELAPGESRRALRYSDWLAVKHFPAGEQVRAANVMWCESRGRDDVVGAAGEVGRFQIHPIHEARFAHLDLTDAEQNGIAAAELWREVGWQAWACAK